ncbi:MAG: CoA transferase [Acidobacteria bacterium]|nr:CoA transferase [Acidobacteriota bacterium]
MNTPSVLPQALDDIVVVEFAAFAAGPCIGKYLANHGAFVAKVESHSRPDGFRAHYPPFKNNQKGVNRSGVFAMNNDGVRSIGINLKIPAGLDIARKLASKADVVIENFTPGTMKRLGLGYEELSKANPRLVMLSTCNLGQTGPRAQHPGFGSQLTSLSGFTHLIGESNRNPVIAYGPYIDYIAVGFGYIAILAALEYCRRTGHGQYIDLSQYEGGVHFVAPAILESQLLGTICTRQGNRHSVAAPHAVYRCAEPDSWCAISVFDDAEWSRLASAMGDPEWARSQRFATQLGRKQNEAELDALLAQWTRRQDPARVMERLQEAGVHAAKVLNVAELYEDSQLAHRNFWGEVVQQEVGPHHVENPAFHLSRTPHMPPQPDPLLNEHTDRVLERLLGLTKDQIDQLAAAGAVERPLTGGRATE